MQEGRDGGGVRQKLLWYNMAYRSALYTGAAHVRKNMKRGGGGAKSKERGEMDFEGREGEYFEGHLEQIFPSTPWGQTYMFTSI